MTDTEREWDESRIDWHHFGRSAERFARRIARDASRFAEKVQEHTGEFAEEISRDWARATRCDRRGRDGASNGPELRAVFDDIRGLLSDVIDGVDELIARVFRDPDAADERAWTRMVVNRAVVCIACDQPVKSGDEAWVRRTAAGIEARCLTCGEPAPEGGDDGSA